MESALLSLALHWVCLPPGGANYRKGGGKRERERKQWEWGSRVGVQSGVLRVICLPSVNTTVYTSLMLFSIQSLTTTWLTVILADINDEQRERHFTEGRLAYSFTLLWIIAPVLPGAETHPPQGSCRRHSKLCLCTGSVKCLSSRVDRGIPHLNTSWQHTCPCV